MLVNDFLENSAAQRPDKVALVCAGRRLTYAQIEEQANRVANGLLEMGVQPGDRVAVWLPNSVETVIGLFAILKAGATFVVLNATTKFDKLAYVLNNCSARGLFVPVRQADLVPGEARRLVHAERGSLHVGAALPPGSGVGSRCRLSVQQPRCGLSPGG